MREIFRMTDADNSGFIDAEELLELGQAVNTKFKVAKCTELIQRMDTSEDGKVSVEEFLELVSKFDGRTENGIRAMRTAAKGIEQKTKAKLEASAQVQGVEIPGSFSGAPERCAEAGVEAKAKVVFQQISQYRYVSAIA